MYLVGLLCLVSLGAIALWVDRRDRRHGHKHRRISDIESEANDELPRSDRSPWSGYGG